ncbi:hypothetical protein GGE16_000053 [Rhizobium leguminosarum]|uniref:Uncharacterized protein n=1 Tax=Rhizobium leguminosarum TaxID=384 RepID=A0AAE2MEX9_RHILE|nr:hypothetical protein [Rhizobium leguminosarum]MBB4431997.1 hypothetical protein [Rhizobium esperanzae]MBB4295872.1 hypothetical protein [Rhizobium leguminosarum]MBB4307264.1 hypothetical protein [Rhizobium leguminosarum]MBB4417153.1 hypothetical protein [Rhizobium leguminosarum]
MPILLGESRGLVFHHLTKEPLGCVEIAFRGDQFGQYRRWFSRRRSQPMDQTVRLATEHGVGIGAHPGYNDLQGFGRRKIAGTAKELVNDMSTRWARRENSPAATAPGFRM